MIPERAIGVGYVRLQDSTAEQRERLRLRMASHEACHAAIASLRRGSFSSQSLTCGTDSERTFARMKVPFEMLQRRRRRRKNPAPQGRRCRPRSESVPQVVETEKRYVRTGD